REWVPNIRVLMQVPLARSRRKPGRQRYRQRVLGDDFPLQEDAAEGAVLPDGLIPSLRVDFAGLCAPPDPPAVPIVNPLALVDVIDDAVGVATHDLQLDTGMDLDLVPPRRAIHRLTGIDLTVRHGHHLVVLQLLVVGGVEAANQESFGPRKIDDTGLER